MEPRLGTIGNVRFRVLGPIRMLTSEGHEVELGTHHRLALLAALLARSGQVVAVETLADLLWGERQPAHPRNAVQVLVSRLRSAARRAGSELGELETQAPGYVLRPEPEAFDAERFERLLKRAQEGHPADKVALLREALDLWSGRAYAGLTDDMAARMAALRLEELRLDAVEGLGQALLEDRRAQEAVAVLDPFVREHPLREGALLLLMRALYQTGRHAEAVRRASEHRATMAEELGLEPSRTVTELESEILAHRVEGDADDTPTPPGARLHHLQARYISTSDGPLALSEIGSGPRLVVIPAWVSSLEVISAGRDPRSSVLERLSRYRTVVLYDRRGTGLTGGEVEDFSFDAAAAELETLMEATGGEASVLAMSQSGPAAVLLAARRPDLVRSLIMFGTFASGPETFRNTDLSDAIVDLLSSHWGVGSRLMAALYRPGRSDAAADHLARVLRDSAPPEVAVEYLAPVFDVDVSHLLGEIRAPTLVIHYRGDRVIPFAGGVQLASGIADARFLPLEGTYHLPDSADLDRIVEAIVDITS